MIGRNMKMAQLNPSPEELPIMIDFSGENRTSKQIIRSMLDAWRNSEKRLDMIEAEKYYKVKNSEIQKKERSYIDTEDKKQINDTLSNAKIPSAYLRINVQQKVNYALSRPFVLSVGSPIPDQPDENTGEIISDSLKDEYLQRWTEFLTDDVRNIIRRTAVNAVNKGIGWTFVTIIDGEFKMFDMRPEQICTDWKDDVHKEKAAIIRDYIVARYVNDGMDEINYVDFWNDEIVEKFIDNGGALVPNENEPDISAHMELDGEGISWGRIPFVALKGTEDELPVLNVIKGYIDAIDSLKSKTVDALIDDIDPLLVVEDITTDMNDLKRIRTQMKNSRVMSIDKDGKVFYVQVNPNIDAVQKKLEDLKKDIREFGQSVDTQDVRFGSNPSGVALKSMYQDLDIYTNGFENEFRAYMQELKYFFDIYLEFVEFGTAAQWSQYKLSVKFDRDMMLNTSADIADTVALMSTGISIETLDNWNPSVESHEIEQARREAEEKSSLDNMVMERKLAELQAEDERLAQGQEGETGE